MLPRPLQPSDTIALVTPARFTDSIAVEHACQAIFAAGFEPFIAPDLLARDGQFGGTDAQRAEQLNQAFRSPDVRAVWAMRGGYGCARILPLLDAAAFRKDPTWICGFSDVTALHAWSNRLGVAALHAPVAGTFASTLQAEQLWTALAHPEAHQHGRHLHLPDERPVVGGNLSVLYSLLGTPYFPDVAGVWLLLEDLDEYLYHLDRMLNSFRLAGVFERMHGLVMGSFTDLHDNTIAAGQTADNPFGRTLRDMVADHVPAGKPVVWEVPVGHGKENVPVVLG